tara:strand:+ start:572 stop:979 length:408 start_codon:yes stop_codon:yes gene_type:complete
MIGLIASTVKMLGVKGIAIAVVSALLLATIGVKQIRINHLEDDLVALNTVLELRNTQIAVGRANVAGMKASIHMQNDAIENMKRHSEHRAEEAARVVVEAARLKKELSVQTARLSAVQGESCEEGIALLDLELGL